MKQSIGRKANRSARFGIRALQKSMMPEASYRFDADSPRFLALDAFAADDPKMFAVGPWPERGILGHSVRTE